jgi:hypothetical protein
MACDAEGVWLPVVDGIGGLTGGVLTLIPRSAMSRFHNLSVVPLVPHQTVSPSFTISMFSLLSIAVFFYG